MKRWISLLLAALLALHMGAALAQSYSQGDYADEIATIQQALTDLDLYYAGITGHFGERTEKAVRLFQKKAGLPQTGVADERTIELLYLRTGTQAPAAQTGSTGGTISVDQLLREGSTGSAVRALQEKLKALGNYDGTVTGRYGPLTKEAVRRFQRANGLTADGIAGPKTLTALGQLEAGDAAAGESSLNGGAQGNDSLLRLNSSGSAVRALQTNLQTLGYYGGAVTGNYGRLTKEAVRVFQREHDLSADGVAGPRTLAAIQGELAREEERAGLPETPVAGTTPAPGTTASPDTTIAPAASPDTGALAAVERLNTEWVLRRTSRNGHVTRLQKALAALGYFKESATGYFGSATEEAVIAYQKARGLTADGIAGRATLTAINQDLEGGSID